MKSSTLFINRRYTVVMPTFLPATIAASSTLILLHMQRNEQLRNQREEQIAEHERRHTKHLEERERRHTKHFEESEKRFYELLGQIAKAHDERTTHLDEQEAQTVDDAAAVPVSSSNPDRVHDHSATNEQDQSLQAFKESHDESAVNGEKSWTLFGIRLWSK